VSEQLTKEAFEENLNTKFRILLPEFQTAELELTEVLETMSTPGQQQFSIFFRSPPQYLLSQGTYRMEHEKLGELHIFIVPVGREQDAFLYEAVFNYVPQG
jgi:hypothetical protein